MSTDHWRAWYEQFAAQQQPIKPGTLIGTSGNTRGWEQVRDWYTQRHMQQMQQNDSAIVDRSAQSVFDTPNTDPGAAWRAEFRDWAVRVVGDKLWPYVKQIYVPNIVGRKTRWMLSGVGDQLSSLLGHGDEPIMITLMTDPPLGGVIHNLPLLYTYRIPQDMLDRMVAEDVAAALTA